MRVKAALATLVATAGASLATQAPALAAPAVTLDAGVSASGASKGAPTDAVVRTKVAIDPGPGADPAAPLPGAQRLTLDLGAGLTTSLDPFSSCAPDDLRKTGPKACPAGSRLGTVKISFDAYVGGSALRGQSDEAFLFRGTGTDGVVLYNHTSEPAESVLVFQGTLKDTDGGPQLTLDTSSSAKVQGFDVALRTVELTLDAKGSGARGDTKQGATRPRLPSCGKLEGRRRRACVRRSRDLEFCPSPKKAKRRAKAKARQASGGVTALRSTGCPSGGRTLRATLGFTDGTSATAEQKLACA